MFLHLSVGHSVQGGCLADTPQADIPLDRHPQADTPRQTPPVATATDGTHPTGMLSCFIIILYIFSLSLLSIITFLGEVF